MKKEIKVGDLVVAKQEANPLNNVVGVVIKVEDHFYKSKYIAWQHRYTVVWSNGEKTYEPHNFLIHFEESHGKKG